MAVAVVAGGWWLVAGGGWRLLAGGGWRLLAGGWCWLVGCGALIGVTEYWWLVAGVGWWLVAGVGWLAVDLNSASYFAFRSAPSSIKAMKAMKVSKKPAVAPPASKQDKKALLKKRMLAKQLFTTP